MAGTEVAPQFVSATANGNITATTTGTVTIPDASAGDLMLLRVVANRIGLPGGILAVNTSGWTYVTGETSVTTGADAIYRKVVTDETPGDAVSFTLGGGGTTAVYAATITAYRYPADTPIEVTARSTTNDGVAPSLTVGNVPGTLVCFWAKSIQASQTIDGFTAPAGMGERVGYVNDTVGGSLNDKTAVLVADEQVVSAGAIGTRLATNALTSAGGGDLWRPRISVFLSVGALPYGVVSANAGDRLRSNVSETTGSLLEAVDARAVDASVSEAYTYAQELPATTLVTYREVLRARDSATADFAYYPQPRQNIVMENQYTGLTILGRLARYYPPRIYNDVVSLGLSGIPAATATDCINYVLTQWAADNDWLTFETVPDLRVPMPGLAPSDYGVGTGQVYASTIAIKQDGSNRRDALTILRDLLSPFPGTVVRQNSAGNLEIVPASGPDADETAFVTLDTKDLYSVTIGKPNEFDTINRCVVSSTGGAVQSEDVAVMQPAWFQWGSSYQFGRANWYSPPADRLNLQPFDDATDDTLQEGLTTSSNPDLQKPVLWPISGDAIPAGDGISLVSTGGTEQVTIAWARYFNDSLVSSGTSGLTIVTEVIPFSGEWVTAFRVDVAVPADDGYLTIEAKWNEVEQGVELRKAEPTKLETNCAAGCNGIIIEFVLGDASVGYAEGSAVTAAFGFVGDDPDILPGVNSADAVLESQTALGIVERRIDIRGYVFDATTLYQIARGYVLQNITPKVTRELDVAALSGYRVLFDNIGRLHELPSGDVGFLTGVTYTDDFVSGIVRKTATVEVRDLGAAGAVDTTTDFLLMDDGSFWQSDDGSLSEVP